LGLPDFEHARSAMMHAVFWGSRDPLAVILVTPQSDPRTAPWWAGLRGRQAL